MRGAATVAQRTYTYETLGRPLTSFISCDSFGFLFL